MNQFEGKTAVITGAASGIGLGIAQRCAKEGMHLVLVDIEQHSLDEVRATLADTTQGEVLARRVDVGSAEQVAALADEVFARFTTVELLVNNAGVGGGGRNCWDLELEYWDWVLKVNLWGVIHGIKFFVPRMQAQNEGHVINTASVAGLMSAPGSAAYNVSKHGVVTLSETLYGELRNSGSALNVSVLCPSYVDTRIYDAERNRPGAPEPDENQRALNEAAGEFFSAVAMSTSSVAEQVFEAVAEKRFYILPHSGAMAQVEQRLQGIVRNEPAQLTGAEDFPLS